ncbi:2'-5' RNA ligase [Niastella koreensis]|uniref:Phosphoesterase HXTX n=2 Tax=Niastella koreensis TaxID=354356 RepID=G8TE26_NIAKG|nr:RNA 2',3'-cyclic phosphodiesterase [Niastella koreensis]AEW03574.1 Phosphoesterase HXTX [Niastella koreensis GR20-10]OQP53934.1 2'-5' RNA ligase [Niastella koreensis]
MLHFIAIVAPEEINQQVLQWKHYMKKHFQCKVALKSPAHITLIPPFELPDSLQTEMQELLLPFASRRQSFPIQLKNFAAFKPRVIYVDVLPGEPLNELKTALETTLLQSNRFPIKKEDRPFHPHVTIANRDLRKEDFPLAWQHFQQINYEASFIAGAISLLRHNGQVWEIACSFPFNN